MGNLGLALPHGPFVNHFGGGIGGAECGELAGDDALAFEIGLALVVGQAGKVGSLHAANVD